MRVRHTTPSIFNLSMVDVVFCTLGCVILLWLWKMENETELSRKNEEVTSDRDKKQGLLADITQTLAQRDKELSDLRNELKKNGISIEELRALLASTESERDKMRKQRDDLDKQVATLNKLKQELQAEVTQAKKDLGLKDAEYKTSQERGASLDKRLKELEMQLAKLEGLTGKVTGLETQVKTTKEQLDKEKLTAKELEAKIGERIKELTELTGKLERLQKVLEATQKESKDTTAKLDQSTKQGVNLQKILDDKLKELEELTKKLESARVERGKWELKAEQWEAISKNRFAGISLTGKRVVFLLDMSGSMELLAETKPAPTKWAEVQATLVNLMKSMPNLDEFQLIGFSDKPRFLLGGDGEWIKYDPAKSPGDVGKALSDPKNKPNGGTNMFAAMETTFALRAKGLDTIYLLSDGLPNDGEGLTDNEKRTLTDRQKSEKLGAHVRAQLESRWNKPDEKKQRVKINSVGFYYESPDLGAFLWALSRENDGNFVGMSSP